MALLVTQQGSMMRWKPTFSVVGPNRFRKNKALQRKQLNKKKSMTQVLGFTNATIRLLSNMSFLETTAKYEMLMKRYTALTEIMARGAARLMVRTGSRTSERA